MAMESILNLEVDNDYATCSSGNTGCSTLQSAQKVKKTSTKQQKGPIQKASEKVQRNRLGKAVAEIARSVPLCTPKQDKATILENAVLYLEYLNRNVTNVSLFNMEFLESVKKGHIPEPQSPPRIKTQKPKKKSYKKEKQPIATQLKPSGTVPTIIRVRSRKPPAKDASNVDERDIADPQSVPTADLCGISQLQPLFPQNILDTRVAEGNGIALTDANNQRSTFENPSLNTQDVSNKDDYGNR